jgi:Flp pilus assembly pilin Flp
LVIALVAFGCAATMQSLATGIHTEFSTVISVISSAMA